MLSTLGVYKAQIRLIISLMFSCHSNIFMQGTTIYYLLVLEGKYCHRKPYNILYYFRSTNIILYSYNNTSTYLSTS